MFEVYTSTRNYNNPSLHNTKINFF